MTQYLLSTFAVDDESEGTPGTPEEMRAFMQRVMELEADMDAKGKFVFGGALHSPDASTVIRDFDNEIVVTDGPFVESKEHVAGFYIIDAHDLDEALEWAERVVEAIGRPIEVRPFAATGRVADQMGKGD